MELQGLVTAICTPFTDEDQVDEQAFVAHLEFLAHHGCEAILVSGTNGEFFSLRPWEKHALLGMARKHFRGTVLFHASGDSLALTLEQAQWAQEAGAAGIAALPPYYYADVSPAGVIQYLRTLAEAVRVPFVIYNFPRHTQVPITEEILAAVPHFALKDTSRTLSLIAHTPRYFVGGDTWICRVFDQGGRGFISGLSNAFPALFSAMGRAFRDRDRARMEKLQKQIDAAANLFSMPNSIARIKYAISRQVEGFSASVRAPLMGISTAERAEIEGFLRASG